MYIYLAVLKSPNNRKKNNSWHKTFINQNNKKNKFIYNKWRTESSGFMFQHINRIDIVRIGLKELFLLNNIVESDATE
jgi:hypothetical protein